MSKTILLNEEEEILQLTDGQYFGEWGIINEKPRMCSSYALEDCDLFILDKRPFINSIGVFLLILRNVWLILNPIRRNLY